MNTIRLTLAQAIVRFLTAQKIEDEGRVLPLFSGVHAIFGHGNVTCLGSALAEVQDKLPTYRGQNEQSMALAAVAYARARRRKQIHVCSSSIGPGSTNMLTAAGVALSDRLPVLFLCGDNFATRFPDPVLQQVEHAHDLTITANDAFKAVSAFFDRISRPEQIFTRCRRPSRSCSTQPHAGRRRCRSPRMLKGKASTIPSPFSKSGSIAFRAIAPTTTRSHQRPPSSDRRRSR